MLRLKTTLIAFHHLPRSHTGVNITTALIGLFDRAGITDNVSLDPQLGPFLLHDYFQIGHFTLDNTANNKTAMAELKRLLGACGIDFNPQDSRIMCLPHVLNICSKHATDDFASTNLTSIAESSFDFPSNNVSKQAYIEALKVDPVARARDVVCIVRSSSLHHESFKEIILDGNIKKYWRDEEKEVITLAVLELIHDVKTRWDSRYCMVKRL